MNILLSEKFNWVVSHITFPLLTKCSIGICVLIVRIQLKMVGMNNNAVLIMPFLPN